MRPESTGRARGAGDRVERLVRSPSHALTHPHATFDSRPGLGKILQLDAAGWSITRSPLLDTFAASIRGSRSQTH